MLRGSVHEVFWHRYNPLGTVHEVWTFAPEGELVSMAQTETSGDIREFVPDMVGNLTARDCANRIVRRGEDYLESTDVPDGLGDFFWTDPSIPGGIGFGVQKVRRIECRYDGLYRMQDTTFFNLDGEAVSQLTFGYDEWNRVVRVAQSTAFAFPWPDLFDSQWPDITAGATIEYQVGRRIIRQYLGDLEVTSVSESYNSLGDPVTEERDGESPTRIEYQYDDRSNWIERRVIPAQAPEQRDTRTITYY